MKYLNKLSLRNAPRGALLLNPLVAAAAIGAGASLLNGGVSQMLGRSNLNKQNELARENILLSNSLNRQNALEQGVMQRMATQGAGLNINSDKGIFQVAGSSPVSSSVVQTNPQFVDPSVLSTVLNSSKIPSEIGVNKSQGALNESQIAVNDANVYKIGEEVNEILENIHIKELQGEAQQIENKWLDNIRQSEFNLNWSQVALNDFRSLSEEQQQALVPHMVKKIYSEIMLNQSSSQNQIAQAKEAIANALYKDEERKFYQNYIDSVIRSNNALAGKSDAEKNKLSTELLILSKEVSWYEFKQVMDAVRAGADVASAIAKIRVSGKVMRLKPSAVRSLGASNYEM